MSKIIIGASLVLVGVVAWRIGGHLNSDAIAMALGVCFGMVAGIPIALLVVAGAGRVYHDEAEQRRQIRAEVEQEIRTEVEQCRLSERPGVWRVAEDEVQLWQIDTIRK